METMAISKFKATCLAVLERVRRTRSPILITRFGRPIAEITPPSPPKRPDDWLGALEGTARIRGDIVGPIGGDDWESLRD